VNTWICVGCGNVDAEDAFCSKCGTREPASPSHLNCSNETSYALGVEVLDAVKSHVTVVRGTHWGHDVYTPAGRKVRELIDKKVRELIDKEVAAIRRDVAAWRKIHTDAMKPFDRLGEYLQANGIGSPGQSWGDDALDRLKDRLGRTAELEELVRGLRSNIAEWCNVGAGLRPARTGEHQSGPVAEKLAEIHNLRLWKCEFQAVYEKWRVAK
jgi:hypothetical protein